MRDIHYTTGPVDYSEEPGEAGDSPASSKKSGQELIIRASAVPILSVFKWRGVHVDVYNRQTRCPFRSHKNGQESRPSFRYYPESNSFNCFGCHKGGGPVHFIMHMDGIDREDAAVKILEEFEDHVDEDLIFEGQNLGERTEIMAEFSQAVQEFRQNYSSDHAFQFIEYLCWVYDRLNLIHKKSDNDALRGLNVELIACIQSYEPSLHIAFEEKYPKNTCTP